MDKTLPDDRRRYFRISDHIGLAYRVIADDHLAGAGEVRSEPVRIFELLVEHDEVIARLLEQLRPRDPIVTELAASLNKKINCLVNQLEMESRMIEQIAHKICEVNISACGLGFRVDEAISTGTRVQLDMVLLPENRRLLAQAVVIACEPGAESHYVRMDYVELSAHDQEFLIQHIVKRQGDLLREAREQAEQALRGADVSVPAPPKSSGV